MPLPLSHLIRRIRLSQLQIIEAVKLHGSILGASKSLHLSQPAVTKAIQDLEKTLGQRIFTRTSQGVHLTEFGLMIEQHINSLITQFRYFVDDLNSWNSGISGRIVVGTMLTASVDFLPRAIMRLKKEHPHITVEVKVGINEKLYPDFMRGEVDIMVGLITNDAEEDDFIKKPLFEETLCAVVGKQHALASTPTPDWAQEKGLNWIIPPSSTIAGASAKQFFEQQNISTPLRVIESVSILTNLEILIESDYVALMPCTVASRFIQLGLLQRLPLKQVTPLGSIGYTLLKNRPITPACQHFIDALSYNKG